MTPDELARDRERVADIFDVPRSLLGLEPPPDEHVPILTRIATAAITWATWPLAVRAMRRAGFRRTGWMTWETGPPDDASRKADEAWQEDAMHARPGDRP